MPPLMLPATGELSKDPALDRTLRHSLSDGAAFALMIGMAESYFSAFAILLRASAAQLGVIAAVPPLLGALTQIGSAWLGRDVMHRRRLIVIGAVVQAGALLPLAVLPLLLPEHAIALLLAFAVLYYAGPNIGAPHWGSLMGDLVPEARRGRFFALRNRLSSLANFLGLIAAGGLLEASSLLEAPRAGFVTIFALAAIARLVSAWHLWRMQEPERAPLRDRRRWLVNVREGYAIPALRRFSLFVALMQGAVALASPFFALYMLRDLGFGYLEFMLNTAASVVVQFLTLARWGRLSDLFGNRLILRTTGTIIPFVPLLWLLSENYVWLLLVQMLSGLCWAGFSLSAANSLFDLIPSERRTPLMATHNVFVALGVFSGAMLGGWLATTLPAHVDLGAFRAAWASPLLGVFVISSCARGLVSLVFLRRLEEPRRVRPMNRRGVIFRVTRLHPVSAAVFEVIGRTTEDRRRRQAERPGERPGER